MEGSVKLLTNPNGPKTYGSLSGTLAKHNNFLMQDVLPIPSGEESGGGDALKWVPQWDWSSWNSSRGSAAAAAAQPVASQFLLMFHILLKTKTKSGCKDEQGIMVIYSYMFSSDSLQCLNQCCDRVFFCEFKLGSGFLMMAKNNGIFFD